MHAPTPKHIQPHIHTFTCTHIYTRTHARTDTFTHMSASVHVVAATKVLDPDLFCPAQREDEHLK